MALTTIYTDLGLDYIKHCDLKRNQGKTIPKVSYYLQDNYETASALLFLYGYQIVYLRVPYYMY